MFPPLVSLLLSNYFIFPLYECPEKPELRCVSARFTSSRLSPEDNALVRPLVIATQRGEVTVSCHPHHPPFTLRDASISIDYSPYIPLPAATLRSQNCIGGIPPLGLGAFSRTWTDFVLTPDEMIMNPQPNTTFCQSGNAPDVYFQSASPRQWIIRSAIQIAGHNSTEDLIDLEMNTASAESILPRQKYDEFIEAIMNQSFETVETRHGNWGFATVISNCNGRRREDLPIISLMINDPASNSTVTELQIGPDDYLTQDCRLTISAAHIRDSTGVIGDNILKNLAIHFRSATHTMGFCDPI